jgi:death-on-curing protein
MTEWLWVRADAVHAIHDRQIDEHGGLDGVRDREAIESALSRPQNLAVYGEPAPDVPALAAAYAFGLASNHGFADGNKRTAWIVARLFLRLNGCEIAFEPQDAIRAMEGLAAGTIGEADLAAWFRARIRS